MIHKIRMPDGELLFVEAELSENNLSDSVLKDFDYIYGLPAGGRKTGADEEIQESRAGVLLKAQIQSLAKISLDALSGLNPAEMTIEAHIKFSSDLNIIPFIASAKGDGGIKISLTWKREQQK